MKKRNKVIRLITLAISVVLLVSLLGTGGIAFAEEDEDSGKAKSIPPGQMVRSGVSGNVTSVNVTDDGYYYFLVETNFGIVQVLTNETTNQTVNASMIGHRVAVKLEKVEGGASEYAHNGTGNMTGGKYRVATALQFRLIPSKGTKQHKWGTVESLGQGCVFVDEDGNQIPAKCGNSSGNVIGLVGGSGNGTGGNGTALLLQTWQMSRIQLRIQQRIQQFDCEGDPDTCERLQDRLQKCVDKQERLEEKRADRAEKGLKKGKNK